MPFSILAHPSSILPRGLGRRIERAPPRHPLVSSEIFLFTRKSTRVFAGFSISGDQFWRERRFDSLRTSPEAVVGLNELKCLSFDSMSLCVGYIRIIANCVAFALCFSDKKVFAALYFVSFVCDELDGRFARMFNQVSTFGAVLDMGKHRLPAGSPFPLLQIMLYFLSGAACFGYCKPLVTDVQILYIILFLVSGSQSESVIDVLVNNVRNKSMFSLPILVALPGWAVKQVVNVIQMKTAADVCVLYDSNRRERP
ncbi:CDP-diacylglycerol--inositol 3-phosphatidyltransferase 1 [Nymphaea thermarum]|nr:CDP-diacylglycerol--inositol 3-phosphatidyltransferase 1 [Nymphaea thermarum]